MSIRVQDFYPIQQKVAKRTDSGEQIFSKNDTSRNLQKQLISFQGAQALRSSTLVPSFSSERELLPNYYQTFIAENKTGTVPKFKLMTGKFNPSGSIRDEELGLRIIFLSGSKIEGKDFRYVMPGSCLLPGNEGNRLSFSGNSQVGIVYHNMEPQTHKSFQSFVDDKIPEQVAKGDYLDVVEANNPTIAIAAGGFGTRFLNISGKTENKTSGAFPTRPSFRVMGCALSMTSMLGGLNDPSLTKFFSQTGQLEKAGITGENIIRINNELDEKGKPKNLEDGGGLAEALAKGHLDSDKDMIIMGADSFTNADLTRTYKALKDLPEAAVVIPYYPEPKERLINTFGLISAKVDENDNKVIEKFVEKPKPDTDFSKLENARAQGTDKYMINPGMYIFSKEVVQILKEKGKKGEAVGLGGNFVPEIVEMCSKGELKTADGKPMKVYTVPLERKGGELAEWDDVGSAEAYASRIRDVADETNKKGIGPNNKYFGIPEFVLEDFADSVDLNTGVICGKNEKTAFEKFKEKYNILEDGIKGNVVVLPLNT